MIVLQNAGVGATILPWRLRAPGPQAEVVVAGPRSSSGSVKRKNRENVSLVGTPEGGVASDRWIGRRQKPACAGVAADDDPRFP